MKTLESRFWGKVEKTSRCWNWKGCKDKNGYGSIFVKSPNKTMSVHRLSFKLANGFLPRKLDVCHTCDNPGCVNPKHLWVGTAKENIQDCIKKKRFSDHHGKYLKERTHCPKKHLYDKENTYVRKTGGRACRACHRQRTRERRSKK